MSGLPIRPNILAMQPYSPGKPIDEVKRELGLTDVVKLASNENPLGPSPLAVAAVKAAADMIHVYPDGSAHDLRAALASKYNLAFDQVLVGNGSDELIHLLGQVFLGKSTDEIIVGDPSFVRYDAAAGLANCVIKKVPVTTDMELDLEAFASATTENTKLIFIANPNNPTGTVVTHSQVVKLLKSIPSSVAVVLDEAYYEFAAHHPEFPRSIELLSEFPNVIVMRTFSKAYGLAGIRIGYAFVSPEVSDAVHRAREPFHVNSLAQIAGIAALGDSDHLAKTVQNNQTELDRMAAAFESHGFKPVASFANFMLVDLGQPARPIFDKLLNKGIITRSGDVLGLPTYLRVSVGTADEISTFLNAFSEIFS
ncbi:MAG TPA: histidinol-phosphate transaminase [Fimbriimonas sp.]|nr:histidinol-phosphate transaminase [Fimbriimonas sp.]